MTIYIKKVPTQSWCDSNRLATFNLTRNSSAELGGTSGGRSGSILALLTCTLQVSFSLQYTSLSSSVSIFPGACRSVSIFFILYRSKLHLENELQVDLRCARTPSRAATVIVIIARVTSEQEIYTPCQTATWEKSTGGANSVCERFQL